MAQAVSGTILGTVVDQSGAVVSNANVSIVLTGQNDEHVTLTNESGNFTQPNLPPGNYTITVTALDPISQAQHAAQFTLVVQ